MIQKWGRPEETLNLWTKMLFSMSEEKLQELGHGPLCRSCSLVLALAQVLPKTGSPNPMPNLTSRPPAQCHRPTSSPLHPDRYKWLGNKVKMGGKIIFATAFLCAYRQSKAGGARASGVYCRYWERRAALAMWMGSSSQIQICSATRAHDAEIKLGVRP